MIKGPKVFRERVKSDLNTINRGKNGAALIAAAERSSSTITIGRSADGKNYTTPDPHIFGRGSDAKIEYNPDRETGGKDEKGDKSRPAFVGLAHELGHAVATVQGKQSLDLGEGKTGTTPPAEKEAMSAENGVRQDHKLPLRKNYYEN